MTPKQKKIYYIIAFSMLLGPGLYLFGFWDPIFSFFYSKSLSKEEKVQKMKEAKKEYFGLFSQKAQKDLDIHNNIITRQKFSYMNVRYRKYYDIVINKIKIQYEKKLKDSFKIKTLGVVENTSGIAYAGYESGNFKFSYSFECDSVCQNIIIEHDGTVNKSSFIGDSILNLNIKAKGMAVSYDQEAIRDMVLLNITPKIRPAKNEVMHLALYKKQGYIYIIFIYADTDDSQIGEALFRSLFIGDTLK